MSRISSPQLPDYPITQSRGTPRFIYLFGVDGAGKTTLARLMKSELDKIGIKSKSIRLRINYFFTRPILLYCRLAGYTIRKNINGVPIVYHEFYRSTWIPKLVQYFHLLDTSIMFFFKAYLPLKLGKRVILCDRFAYDVLIDFMIEARDHSLHEKKIGRFLISLLPQNSKSIFINTDVRTILQRKPEVAYDKYFKTKYALYQKLDQVFHFDKIDNDGDLKTAVEKLMAKLGFTPPSTTNTHNERKEIYLQKEEVCLGA